MLNSTISLHELAVEPQDHWTLTRLGEWLCRTNERSYFYSQEFQQYRQYLLNWKNSAAALAKKLNRSSGRSRLLKMP